MAKRRKDKKICAECGQRKALRFSQRRGFVWDPEHQLCSQCWRALCARACVEKMKDEQRRQGRHTHAA